MINLISNAIKFTNKNKNIYLNVTYINNFLSVHIKDEGIGISEKYVENIFNAFTQEDTSTTRKYGGSGLGLAISFNLVRKMGGELKLKTDNDIGAEFYFSLPLEEVKQNLEIKKNIYTSELISTNLKILLVEDNLSNQLFMEAILQQLNIELEIASDGIEACNMFKNKKYDLVLMDENMPNMNGIEATKNILEYENTMKAVHTPIIALTANAIHGDRERFLEAGMDEYLTKPINKDLLFKMIEKVLFNKE